MNLTCTLSEEDSKNLITADCVALLKKHGFSDDEAASYVAVLGNVLNTYRDKFGAEKKIQYFVRKRFKKIECTLIISGEKLNPVDEESSLSTKLRIEKALNHLLVNKTGQISYIYSARLNLVTISSPLIQVKSIWQSPMLWSTILD